MEQKILASALYSRSAYDELAKYDIQDSLSDQAIVLWELIGKYYQHDLSAQHIDKDILKISVERQYPKHGSLLSGVIDGLTETSDINLLQEVIEQRKESVKLRLSQAFASTKEVKIEPLLEEYHALVAGEIENNDDAEVLIAPDIEELMEQRSVKNRIQILPSSLNDNLEGGVLRGHHVVLFAVTEMGKTLFTLNLVRGFVAQGLKVLYIGNEDPLSDLIERFLMCLSGQSKEVIKKDPAKAMRFAMRNGYERVVWAGLSPGTLGEIRSLVDEHQPDVLIVDQIRNLEIGEKNYVRSLEVAAQAMRNFAKRDNLLSISITQAGDSANGKAILGRGDIDSSNVGIPSTADLMLGIGATQEQEFDGIRTLSFPKNKISGNKRTIQAFFNEKIMRVE